jgi:hypothetical protein
MGQSLRLLVCSEAEADLYAYRRGREQRRIVRMIRGRRCTVLDRCMAEWAAAMQFPYCFEGTWESWRTSMRELKWPADAKVLLMVTALDRVLPRAKADFAEMLRSLEALVAGTEESATGMEVVLQCDSAHAEDVQVRLEGVGAKIRPMEE